ncbi:hypothetical protein FHU41_002375 [Psychromicrobium silvestre]|uniref:CopC domain-containing protein n=1 Tax=Psychromicrobium silvestre TaxID=1645614 RepID=A0A7Y9S846_9MICC|nr:copper resistance CopC family protein [Psychromicrobium silvestre]NYE96125.1 hypothetical protein [Psychromicrobium silvestre]
MSVLSPAAPHRLPIRKLLAAVVLTVGVVLALLLPAGAASAHDVVEQTSPANGSTVTVMPTELTISLNNTPAAIGSKIEIKDVGGQNWAQGDVSVLDRVASIQLKSGAPAGQYLVNWRLVSSDGHPIEGTFGFTVSTGVAGSTAGSGATLGTPAPVSTPQAQEQSTSTGGFPWLIAIAVAVALVILVALLIFVRRLRKGSAE